MSSDGLDKPMALAITLLEVLHSGELMVVALIFGAILAILGLFSIYAVIDSDTPSSWVVVPILIAVVGVVMAIVAVDRIRSLLEAETESVSVLHSDTVFEGAV